MSTIVTIILKQNKAKIVISICGSFHLKFFIIYIRFATFIFFVPMISSRSLLVNEPSSPSEQQKKKRSKNYMHALLQDTYDVQDQDDDDNSNDISFDNFYDASEQNLPPSTGGSPNLAQRLQAAPEVRIDMEPNERLIEAIESLKEVIMENTNTHNKARRRGRPTGAGSTPSYKQNGGPVTLKDDKLKVRKDKVIVELRVVFLKIGEIDTLKEQYSADTFMQAKWREPALDGKPMEEMKRIDLDKFWNPLLYIDNILSETKEATWQTVTCNARGEAYILERRRVRGVFMENLELNDFPLDVQDLTVTITSERPDTEIDIIPDENEMSGINVQTFVDQQEWRLHEHIEVSKKVMTQEYSSSNRCHPALSVTCRAARRPGYFYWNVFLVMFFISALSFVTFAVSPELPQNRLQLSFTLLLTSITFKFVINQSLPKISYLTYMDKYVLLSLVILCVVCIWHAVVTIFAHHGGAFMQELERDVFIAFAIIYVICHLVFMFWLYFDASRRRRLMKHKDREYLKAIKKKSNKKLEAEPTIALPMVQIPV